MKIVDLEPATTSKHGESPKIAAVKHQARRQPQRAVNLGPATTPERGKSPKIAAGRGDGGPAGRQCCLDALQTALRDSWSRSTAPGERDSAAT
ncbi:hypothetical protein OHA21_46760 [Actinoplanes sp. NBC_00393]|uniref:hypothetical protein n=1 Tax=Actinoplanes sp. NBC_00393 TaxID=2975953 RepID=UPI002E21D368